MRAVGETLIAASLVICFLASAHAVPAQGDWFERWQLYWLSGPSQPALDFHVTWAQGARAYFVEYVDGTPVSHGGAAFNHFGVRVTGDTDIVARDVSVLRGGPQQGTSGATLLLAQEGYALALWGGGITSVTTSLRSEGEYRLVAEGPAHAYFGHELDGGAFARIEGGAVAAASAGRSVSFDIEHNLIGTFLTLPLPSYQISSATLSTPVGTDQCLPFPLYDSAGPLLAGDNASHCIYNEFEGPGAMGPGEYRFDWTGVMAGIDDIPLVLWADVAWPAGT